MFDKSFGGCVREFEAESDIDWLHTDGFRVPFDYALTLINERRDVFLGYSSASETTAVAIKRYLLSLGAKVLDWQTDFIPSRTILDHSIRSNRRRLARLAASFFSPRMTILPTTVRPNWLCHAIM
jgi:hypothetical protein